MSAAGLAMPPEAAELRRRRCSRVPPRPPVPAMGRVALGDGGNPWWPALLIPLLLVVLVLVQLLVD